MKVMIDPGHGGPDPGVVAHGRRECDTNLLAARALQAELLRYDAVDAKLTHDGNPVGLQGAQRAAMANAASADLLISLHADSSTSTATRGHHVIYSIHGDQRLPQLISDSLATAIERPAFRAPWTRALPAHPDQDYYAIIRGARMPSVIIERGFLSNAEDAALMFDSVDLARQAAGIAAGIANYFGLKKGEVGVFKDVLPGSTYYSAVKAAFEAGLVAGYPDGTLGAKEPITTERMVALLYRLYYRIRSEVATMTDAHVQALIERCKPAVVMITTDRGLGTGFIIHPDGWIATVEHVVKDAAGKFGNIQAWVITDPSGYEKTQAYPATVIETLNWGDVALLKIDAKGLPVLPVVNRAPLEGETVIVVGHPKGYQNTSSKGIVTQDVAVLGGMLDGRFQVDAATNPGNSGGPVIDMAGNVIGIAEAEIQDTEGLNFAILIKELRPLVEKHLPGLIK